MKDYAAPIRSAGTLLRSLLALAALLGGVRAASAELQWYKPVQDFQATPDKPSVEARFAFKNAGPGPVTITSLKTTCGCTTARLDKRTYQPGEQGEVVAVYKFPFQHGALRKLVLVTTDDHPKDPISLDLRVFVHEPLEVKPALVYWRSGAPVEAKSVQFVAYGYPVQIKSVTSSNPNFTATL